MCACRFATGPALFNSDALIQEFYSKEAPNTVCIVIFIRTHFLVSGPNCAAQQLKLHIIFCIGLQIHLLVDTTLSDQKFNIQAFVSRLLTLGDKVLATEFVEMPCEVLFGEAERVGGTMGKLHAHAQVLHAVLFYLFPAMGF